MHLLYEISVWLHLVAVTVWVGGMAFLVLIVVPWLRADGRREATILLRETGRRFRNVGWTCFVILLVTGILNLSMRGVRLPDFLRSDWLASSFGHIVLLKVSLFAAILAVSAIHDFVVGPRAVTAIEQDPKSDPAQALRRRASLLGRLNVLLGLVAIFVGVVIVRG